MNSVEFYAISFTNYAYTHAHIVTHICAALTPTIGIHILLIRIRVAFKILVSTGIPYFMQMCVCVCVCMYVCTHEYIYLLFNYFYEEI
jgi:hypothetical protein